MSEDQKIAPQGDLPEVAEPVQRQVRKRNPIGYCGIPDEKLAHMLMTFPGTLYDLCESLKQSGYPVNYGTMRRIQCGACRPKVRRVLTDLSNECMIHSTRSARAATAMVIQTLKSIMSDTKEDAEVRRRAAMDLYNIALGPEVNARRGATEHGSIVNETRVLVMTEVLERVKDAYDVEMLGNPDKWLPSGNGHNGHNGESNGGSGNGEQSHDAAGSPGENTEGSHGS